MKPFKIGDKVWVTFQQGFNLEYVGDYAGEIIGIPSSERYQVGYQWMVDIPECMESRLGTGSTVWDCEERVLRHRDDPDDDSLPAERLNELLPWSGCVWKPKEILEHA